jgi:hypothetical protein
MKSFAISGFSVFGGIGMPSAGNFIQIRHRGLRSVDYGTSATDRAGYRTGSRFRPIQVWLVEALRHSAPLSVNWCLEKMNSSSKLSRAVLEISVRGRAIHYFAAGLLQDSRWDRELAVTPHLTNSHYSDWS